MISKCPDYEMPKCANDGNGGIKTIYYIDKKDIKFVDGKMIIKRKYGKHKREIIKQVL